MIHFLIDIAIGTVIGAILSRKELKQLIIRKRETKSKIEK